ncbi:unnamed protein product [Didymodactylos carnosus]|uniref:Uncharacterized protein n=1 Tax=Didymodactylos carnosus TaxID=1234261 RepID=A0A814TZU1_9BILA|nr:unnamed protein product [Didymodactylos carnosus]CAF1168488.1 unnamed protein product [Didymodactylos carnosus]CAF3723710.1 unnamed protein product [Didymodactylos carnosus]CAF3932202.1 unnamed protein product [Didymodactylos carnosus]
MTADKTTEKTKLNEEQEILLDLTNNMKLNHIHTTMQLLYSLPSQILNKTAHIQNIINQQYKTEYEKTTIDFIIDFISHDPIFQSYFPLQLEIPVLI